MQLCGPVAKVRGGRWTKKILEWRHIVNEDVPQRDGHTMEWNDLQGAYVAVDSKLLLMMMI